MTLDVPPIPTVGKQLMVSVMRSQTLIVQEHDALMAAYLRQDGLNDAPRIRTLAVTGSFYEYAIAFLLDYLISLPFDSGRLPLTDSYLSGIRSN